MIIGETFSVGIEKIISEERLSRVVRVKMIRDYFDGKKEETFGFFPAEWEKYKARGSFPDIKALNESMIEYYENMSDKEWYSLQRDAKLKDFTDEEIVAEFNRRLDSGLFHKVGIEAHAIIKEEAKQ